ncbi:putative late blight resistance proteinR1A-10 [Sesamum alatum]|uniref:Late blight resistance proteinR1A-10 n=1 Tax=Sesamum alatum TaxID=300844 RepID=A0AAE2CY89_9LAMI|nr:putative late blight resistance proteinR1A-10 [Sesamum alatum]
MADAAITFLLESGAQLVKSYVNLISEAENDLKDLKDELVSLKTYLRHAAKQEKKDEPTLADLERRMRLAVYAAEDTIDNCLSSHAGTSKTGAFKFRGFNRKTISLAGEVKSLRERLVTPVLNEAKNYFSGIQTGGGHGTGVEVTVRKDPGARKDKIVGFEDEEETITKYLKQETKELDVISIIGMPGLGKTTLAWKIYENAEIEIEFPKRIFVYVSQEANIEDVFLAILREFPGEDTSHTGNLRQRVRRCLETTKFLLVLDDVSSIDDWRRIQAVLPTNNYMSKVLITTRETNVGTQANVYRAPHQLRFLRKDESWKLLQLEVFGSCGVCPSELVEIGEYIAEQCRGLPLAVVVIGGVLLYKRSINQESPEAWREVSTDVYQHVTSQDHNVSDIVAWSYKKMPDDDLRDCFLYLGVFPEDYEIPAWTLIRLWISEGFIQHKQGQSLEETAEKNLDELINRNLVMVDKMTPIGKVKTCRVHDVIRQFCITKADEQNLFKEIKKSKEGAFDPPVSDIKNYRRLCIHLHLSNFLSRKPECGHVRSFLCFYKEPVILEPDYISAIPEASKLLRVWDSKSIKFNQFPPKLQKLIHLRYLTLSWDDLKVLPKDISELWNLQTLVIETNSSTLEIKANIWKMIRLRHLKTKAAIKLLDREGEGKAGENLQTLSRLSPECCREEVFTGACNIKKLGIRGRLATLLDVKYSRKTLALLEKLKLVNDTSYESESGNLLLERLPTNFFPHTLKSLTLSDTSLDWSDMSTLAKINDLQVLKLKNKAFQGTSWKAVGDGFQNLKFLLIASTDLVFWEVSTGHLRSLKSLVLRECAKLRNIPLCLAKSLQILEIEHVAETAVESAYKIQEEKEKMQNAQFSKLKLIVGHGCKRPQNWN